jgi:KDO2-lipid IV(A) lauroyltransferase
MLLYRVIIGSFLFILSVLPLKAIRFLGKILGRILFLIPNRHKHITLTNLKFAFPELLDKEIVNLCKKSLIETSTTLLESGYVWIRLPGKSLPRSIQVEGFENVSQSLQDGCGLLLFTPHQANIEILINFLGQNLDCSVPYSNIKNGYLDEFVKKARTKMGVNMVEVNISGVKKLLSNLTRGEAVAIASDQVPELSGGEISKFFGRECLSMSLLWKLHNKTNAKVHSMVCIRGPKGNDFKLIFSPQLEMPNTIKEGVDTMNKELEKCIMLAPEQYAWEYKKYRRAGNENHYK